MFDWCAQKSITGHANISRLLQQPFHDGQLLHLWRLLEEFLTRELREQCLQDVLQSLSQVTTSHLYLARLPFWGYISTTYDTCLESAYKQVHQRELNKRYTSSISNSLDPFIEEQPFILKLYGDISEPSSIVIRDRLSKGPASIDRLDAVHALLKNTPVLFAGFEQADPDYLYLASISQSRIFPSSAFSMLDSKTLSRLQVIIDSYSPNAELSMPLPQVGLQPDALNGNSPLEIYIAYALNDESYFNSLKKQLNILKRQGYNISCQAHEVVISSAWKNKDHLNTAHIILLLVSPDLLDSDFCYCPKMRAAVWRQLHVKNCCVIPILIRPTSPKLLKKTPFGSLEFLPLNGKSVSQYRSKDVVFMNIIEYILDKLDELSYYS